MTSWFRVAMLCGLALSLTAATVGVAFFGLVTWLTLAPLGVGALLALVGALGSLRGARLDGARARLVVASALALATAAALNALALQVPATIDVTHSGRNTLAEASVQVARGLTVPVVVSARLPADARVSMELTELVARFREHTPHLTLERLTADGSDAPIVVSAGERRQKLRFEAGAHNQEEQLTNALRAVTSGARARAYVLAGHGEAAIDDDGPAGLRRFAQALVDEGIEVVPLPLTAVGRVPEDASLVIVAAAKDIPASEATPLQTYLEGGGRLLVLLEPRQASGLEPLLGSVGVQADDDVIIDGSAFAGLLGGVETATGVAYAAHPITAKLGAAMTHFPRARSLSVNPGTPGEVTALVQTGAEAYGEMSAGPAQRSDGDVVGPVTLAMAVTAGTGKLVVVGDASFAQNGAAGMGANVDFAVNAALWLAERAEGIAVRPRGRGGNLLLLTPTSRERIAFVLLYGLPVLLLCAGLVINGRRRRR